MTTTSVKVDLNIFKSQRNNCFLNIYHDSIHEDVNENFEAEPWSCTACTFENTTNNSSCQMCGTQKQPSLNASSSDNIKQNDYLQCDYLKRILNGLKYYYSLKLDTNSSTNDIFTDFCINIYPQMLDDYTHIITTHSDDLDYIHQQLITNDNFNQCDYSECVLFKRYYDNSRRQSTTTNSAESDDDERIIFYREIFDNIHYWLFHLYDAGMRTKKQNINVDDELKEDFDEMEDEHKIMYIDRQFSRMRDNIMQQREKLNINIDRFNDNDNNKFNLQVSKDSNDDDSDITFMDLLREYFVEIHVPVFNINNLDKYYDEEDYDSDAIRDDMDDDIKDSNILSLLNDSKYSSLIVAYVQDSNSMFVFHAFNFFFIYIHAYPYTLII